ncbi:precorrin-6A reductase [Blautia sp. MSJ-19]|uniref:precorrin-6A reductase n=1 Tax=Blautia sp. MSJ-19 TaxID=2841517 RepID=UPI001C0EC664|nr:precorrin-6A reductase [Blautia sp. MSJ-19]MBU5481430.1 precorrin-6A reductase [Blautia sp. MSJ-19]
MYKAIVFAGTTEGYEISRFLSANKVRTLTCVATEYGSRALKENEYLRIHAERLDEHAMYVLFTEEKPELILDATHPYAAEVTANLRCAAEQAQIPYQRVLREKGTHRDAVYVENTKAAVQYLQNMTGNVLLTTGSKELAAYTAVPDYQTRIFARVLSLPSVIDICHSYGFEGRNLIAMQGPFSKELNAAMLRQYDCRYLVTKDSGKAGGFEEKIEAAAECGVIPVIIGRPMEEEGLSVKECKQLLARHFQITAAPHITLLGIGMGSEDTLTMQGKKAVEQADLVIGARRMADAVALPGQDVVYEYRSQVIADYIGAHPEYSRIVIALSGDVGFYSGARQLLDALDENVEVICGISSVVYFMSRIGLSWDDAKIVSAHGRNCNLVSLIRTNKKVFAILGTADGAAQLAEKLTYYGMGEVLLYVGENLSYDDEKIFMKPAKELVGYVGNPLSVICAWNPEAAAVPTTHGLPDTAFIRGKAPMTKAEVRVVSLAKLILAEDSVCYDIGAGTGSVSVEMALRVQRGRVFAIEKKEDALALLEENKKKFALDHMTIVAGSAPEALEDLPIPTHAFIGGSSGNMKEITELLIAKNPLVRIVINCITLETVGEALASIKLLKEKLPDLEWETEVVQLGAARSKEIGRYHMMMGENPIYIITIQAHERENSL